MSGGVEPLVIEQPEIFAADLADCADLLTQSHVF